MVQGLQARGSLAMQDNNVESGCVAGTLAAWSLVDILLWLHGSRKTAMVRVGEGLGAGVLFVREGMLYRCEWGPLGGVAALRALLDVESVPFSVITRPGPQPVPNISMPTEQLLLELAVQQDHATVA